MIATKIDKVVHLIAHLRLGAGRYIVDLALEQARRGLRVQVVVAPDIDDAWSTDAGMESELLTGGVTVTRDVDFFHRQLPSLLRAAELLAPHVSSAHTIANAHSAIPAAVACWAGAPVVVTTCHGVQPERPAEQDLQDAMAFACSDAVTTPSEYWASILRERMHVVAPAVIPVGLDLRRYPALECGGRSGREPLRVVTVCELTRRKGVDILIDVMPHVWNEHPGTELHIIGDGDQSAVLKAQAAAVDCAGRIHFRGFMTRPYLKLGEYDLFALASRSDNMPVAIMEAMLAGLPIVATAVGGIPEIVERSQCGILAAEATIESVVPVLLDLIGRGRRAIADFGHSGEQFARSRFSVTATAESLFEVYQLASRRMPVMNPN